MVNVLWSMIFRFCSVIAGGMIAIFVCVPVGFCFDSFREFAPYTEPEMQPFREVRPFEEKSFDAYSQEQERQPVAIPEYEEETYSGFSEINKPQVTLPEYEQPGFNTFNPMPPIRQGPMSPIPEARFQPFKPLGE